jgi:tRNA A37 N6-isopentenylltransferase MiaA
VPNSVEKHEPVSDIDPAVVKSLKALDPNRPIREADICSVPKKPLFNHLAADAERHSEAKQ